jgi:hypothetical protein
MTVTLIALMTLALCVGGLFVWRLTDIVAERRIWRSLEASAAPVGPAFSHSALADLPEPAQRYFRYTIAEGTPLVSFAEIDMGGQLGFGTQADPGYRPMSATQVLAPPDGLVWQLQVGSISGADIATPETSSTKFWLLNLIPVVRVSGNRDHHRSSFGRVIAEAAIWVPASLLPSRTVRWEGVGDDTARVTITRGRYSQAVELTVAADGQPTRVVIERWSNENPRREFQLQPFGGYLSEFRDFDGYRLPTRVEGGNWIGTPDYFPFYKAEVQAIRLPQIGRH